MIKTQPDFAECQERIVNKDMFMMGCHSWPGHRWPHSSWEEGGVDWIQPSPHVPYPKACVRVTHSFIKARLLLSPIFFFNSAITDGSPPPFIYIKQKRGTKMLNGFLPLTMTHNEKAKGGKCWLQFTSFHQHCIFPNSGLSLRVRIMINYPCAAFLPVCKLSCLLCSAAICLLVRCFCFQINHVFLKRIAERAFLGVKDPSRALCVFCWRPEKRHEEDDVTITKEQGACYWNVKKKTTNKQKQPQSK